MENRAFYKVDYDKNMFVGTWDCEKFISVLVELAARNAMDGDTGCFDLTVKQLRVYSAFCAFTGKEWNGDKSDCLTALQWMGRGLLEIAYTEDDILKIKNILSKNASDDNLLEMMEHTNKHKHLIGLLFSAILRYRAAVEKALNCYSEFITVSSVYLFGAKMAKEIYDAKLTECNDQANELLKALLGQQFQKSFTERELIEHYHYPTVSDKELHEYMIDSL